MIYCIDIDGVLAETKDRDYWNSQPIPDAIEEVNRLYDAGHTIKIFTGRGSSSGKDWRGLTECRLKAWGLKYHELLFGKPDCQIIIDDIALNVSDWRFGFDKRIDVLAEMIANTAYHGAKVLVCGNGGLAAESSHFSAELVGKFAFDIYIPCLSLVDCSPLVTAIANDFSYSEVFAHQVKVLGDMSDILIAMTTSKSPNIIKAIAEARKKGLTTVVLCGTKFTDFIADYVFEFNGKDTAEIQENILKFLHKVAYKAKEKLTNV